MPTEVGQQIATRVDGGVNIEVAYGSCAAADEPIVALSKYDSRAVEVFGEPAGYDAYHSFMPMGRKDNGSVSLFCKRVLTQLLHRFFINCFVKALTLVVVILHSLSQLFCLVGVIGREQPYGICSTADASACIYARPDFIYKVRNGDSSRLQAGERHNGAQAERWTFIDLEKAKMG